MGPLLRALVRKSLAVRSVEDTHALFLNTLSPPLTLLEIQRVKLWMTKQDMPIYESQKSGPAIGVTAFDENRGRKDQDATEELWSATNDFYHREAEKRGQTVHQVMQWLQNGLRVDARGVLLAREPEVA